MGVISFFASVFLLLVPSLGFADNCSKEKMKEYNPPPSDMTDKDQIECWNSYHGLLTYRMNTHEAMGKYLYQGDIHSLNQCKQLAESDQKLFPLISCSCGKLGRRSVHFDLQGTIDTIWDQSGQEGKPESTTLPYRLAAKETIKELFDKCDSVFKKH